MRGWSAALVCLVASLSLVSLYETEASAQTNRSPDTIAAVLGGPSLADSTLVGVSGQLFEPNPDGGWKRADRGGVACRVTSAFRVDGHVWAMCSRAPLFQRVKSVWSAEPLANRGPARAAQISSAPLFSVGRSLYRRVGGQWERVSTAPFRIDSLLATSPRSALAVSPRGEVQKLSGKRWKGLIAAPKRDRGDPIARLFGSPKFTYATTRGGALVHIVGSRPSTVGIPAAAAGFAPRSSCASTDGTVLAVGSASSGERLLRFRGRVATVGVALPSFEADERASFLHCHRSGELLLATSTGRVLVRRSAEPDGGWTAMEIQTAPPTERTFTNPGAKPASAR